MPGKMKGKVKFNTKDFVMTDRDRMAITALNGLLSSYLENDDFDHSSTEMQSIEFRTFISDLAYKIADSMIYESTQTCNPPVGRGLTEVK